MKRRTTNFDSKSHFNVVFKYLLQDQKSYEHNSIKTT